MTRTRFKIGLTGSIGMGKSTVAGFFADLGASVWDADQAVHRLYQPGAAGHAAIAKICPEAAPDHGVDRQVLKKAIAADGGLLSRIEAAIHPLVAADRDAFAKTSMSPVLVFDIPLLFENGSEHHFDLTLVVSAPLEVQKSRVLARDGMSEATFQLILDRQMPDAEKRARADIVIDTGCPIDQTRTQVEKIMTQIKAGQYATRNRS